MPSKRFRRLTTKENDRPVPQAPSESMANVVTLERGDVGSVSSVLTPDAPPTEPDEAGPAPEPVTVEKTAPVPAAPSEDTSSSVLVEATPAPNLAAVFTAAPAEPVTVENTAAVPAAPSEDTSSSVLVEATPAPSSPPAAPVAQPAERSAGMPARVLPRRPRLRVSFFYDNRDSLNVELTLMDERRELIHRTTLQPVAGGAIARIFEALIGVAVQSAHAAGVFGARPQVDSNPIE